MLAFPPRVVESTFFFCPRPGTKKPPPQTTPCNPQSTQGRVPSPRKTLKAPFSSVSPDACDFLPLRFFHHQARNDLCGGPISFSEPVVVLPPLVSTNFISLLFFSEELWCIRMPFLLFRGFPCAHTSPLNSQERVKLFLLSYGLFFRRDPHFPGSDLLDTGTLLVFQK